VAELLAQPRQQLLHARENPKGLVDAPGEGLALRQRPTFWSRLVCRANGRLGASEFTPNIRGLDTSWDELAPYLKAGLGAA
jgi:hypothetical protein